MTVVAAARVALLSCIAIACTASEQRATDTTARVAAPPPAVASTAPESVLAVQLGAFSDSASWIERGASRSRLLIVMSFSHALYPSSSLPQ